jgi:ABC-type uncharacterized transport system ATPase subunit
MTGCHFGLFVGVAEVLGISDRVYVLCEGDITAEVPIEQADQDTLMKYAVLNFYILEANEMADKGKNNTAQGEILLKNRWIS